MVRRRTVVVALLVALVLAGAVLAVDAPSPPSDGELVEVVHVTDGDTIIVAWPNGWEERVRYIGIDTPEVAHHPGEQDEPFAREATALNEALVEGQRVLLERDVSDTDRYDRLLRYVWTENDAGWIMVNGALVANGLADVRAYEPDTRHHEYLRWVQDEARDAGVGVYRSDSGTWRPGPCDVAGYVVDGCLGEPEGQSFVERLLDLIGWD